MQETHRPRDTHNALQDAALQLQHVLKLDMAQELRPPTSSGASMVVPSMPISPAASPFLLGTTLNARGLTFLARIMALHTARPACVNIQGGPVKSSGSQLDSCRMASNQRMGRMAKRRQQRGGRS